MKYISKQKERKFQIPRKRDDITAVINDNVNALIYV